MLSIRKVGGGMGGNEQVALLIFKRHTEFTSASYVLS
jgi:hypothetical protein